MNTARSEENLEMCRICMILFNAEKMLCIYEVASLIMSYAAVQISENDYLPSYICICCHSQAKQAYSFKLLCEQSESELRKSLISKKATKLQTSCNNSDVVVNISGTSINNRFDGHSESLDESTEHSPKLVIHNDDLISKDENHLTTITAPNETPSYSCKYCDKMFLHKKRFQKHEEKHENGIKCNICGKYYPTLRQLASHVSIHNRKGAHLCQTCGKQFTMPENLVRHMRIHTGFRPYKCKTCCKSFTQSNELKSHLITHSLEKLHLCNVCGNKFSRKVSLQVHMRRLHSKAASVRSHICTECGGSFKDQRDLQQHIRIHRDERSHVCKICCKGFNRSSNLKVHERIHTGHRPFTCHICQKTFIQKHVLNTHLKTHPIVK